MKQIFNKKKLLLGTFSLSIIFFFVKKINLEDFFNILLSLRIEDAIIGLSIYMFTYYIRVKRLVVVFKNKNWVKLLQFTGIFQLINRTLPFRSGEVFFPILLKNILNIKYSESVIKLFILRVLDLLSSILFFSLIILFLGLFDYIYLLLIIILSILFTWLLFFQIEYLIELTYNIIIKINPRYKASANSIRQDIMHIINTEEFHLTNLFGLSIIYRIVDYILFIYVVYSLGFYIPLNKLLAAIGLSSFSELLPINSLGSFGTLELGWVGALVFLDIDSITAIKSGFASHIIIFSFTILLGLLCLFSYIMRKPLKELKSIRSDYQS